VIFYGAPEEKTTVPPPDVLLVAPKGYGDLAMSFVK